MDYKESRGVWRLFRCYHRCALHLVPVGVSKVEDVVQNYSYEFLDQGFDGVPPQMVAEVVGGKVET